MKHKASSPAKILFFTGIINLRGLDLPESGTIFLAIYSINPAARHGLRFVEKSVSRASLVRMRGERRNGQPATATGSLGAKTFPRR